MPPSFRTVREPENRHTQIALQLIAEGPVPSDRRRVDPTGTATVIAPYLAVTAKHVIDSLFSDFRVPEYKREANFHLSAMWCAQGGQTTELSVEQVVSCQLTDIAFLKLKTAPPFEWPLACIDLTTPSIGSAITAFGYHSAEVTDVDHSARVWSIEREFSKSTGIVTAIHDDGVRRLQFPCVETDARFDGGMSGGPVFNADGKLFGLVCNSVQSEPDLPDMSYVALLWPAVDTTIDFGILGSTGPERVLDMITRGAIKAEGRGLTRR